MKVAWGGSSFAAPGDLTWIGLAATDEARVARPGYGDCDRGLHLRVESDHHRDQHHGVEPPRKWFHQEPADAPRDPADHGLDRGEEVDQRCEKSRGPCPRIRNHARSQPTASA